MRTSPTVERLKVAQAERYELLNEKLRGETIAIDDVRQAWANIRETLKKRLAAIPIRVAAQTRDRKALEIVEKEVSAALAELADDPL